MNTPADVGRSNWGVHLSADEVQRYLRLDLLSEPTTNLLPIPFGQIRIIMLRVQLFPPLLAVASELIQVSHLRWRDQSVPFARQKEHRQFRGYMR